MNPSIWWNVQVEESYSSRLMSDNIRWEKYLQLVGRLSYQIPQRFLEIQFISCMKGKLVRTAMQTILGALTAGKGRKKATLLLKWPEKWRGNGNRLRCGHSRAVGFVVKQLITFCIEEAQALSGGFKLNRTAKEDVIAYRVRRRACLAMNLSLPRSWSD